MPTLEQPVALAGRPASERTRTDRQRELPRPNVYLVAIAASLLIAAVSLAFAASPSYDPWAWLIWGRQVLHLDLQTVGGPTWKPLPVLFTTLFAPFGSAAPKLWLLVARAGGLMGIAMAGALAYRLVRSDTPSMRGRRAAPELVAGVLAAAGVVMLYQYLVSAATGESEGLLLAFVLVAVMRHLDGATRQALVLGFAAALIRPETWPFFALYAGYLWLRTPVARRLVAWLLTLVPVLWFLPELWGSGSLTRGVTWARYPRAGSAAFARCPFCTELSAHGWPLLLTSFKVGVAFALGALAVALLGRVRPTAARLAVLGLAVIGIGWILEEAVLTQLGFTGSDRYLLAPEAVLIVVGAVGWGFALRWAIRRLRAPFAPTAAALGCFTLLTILAPEPGPHLGELLATIRFDGRIEPQLQSAVTRAGGAKRLLACGPIETNSSEAPLVAWTLGAPLRASESSRGAVVIASGSAQDPSLTPSPPAGYRLLAAGSMVRIFSACDR